MISTAAFRAVSLLSLGSILGALAAFVAQVILARVLGPADFGSFAAALVMATLAVPLAGFGVAGYWLRAFGEEGWRGSRWIVPSLRFVLLSGVVVLGLFVLWAFVGPHDGVLRAVLLIFTLVVAGQVGLEIVSAKLQLEERYAALALWQVSQHAGRLLLVVLLFLLVPGALSLLTAAWAYGAVGAALLALAILQLRAMGQGRLRLAGHAVPEAEGRHEASETPNVATVAMRAWPFGFAGILYFIYFQSDIVLLRYLSSPEQAGLYNVAFVVMTAVYLFPSVVYQKYLLPRIHRWAHHDQTRFHRTYNIGNLAMLAVGTLAMGLLWGVAPWGLPRLFGADYAGAVLLLSILAFCAPIRFLATSIGAPLATKDRMRRKVACMAAVALFNVAMNFALIPLYGALGAAIATVLAEALLLALYWWQVRRHVFVTRDESAGRCLV